MIDRRRHFTPVSPLPFALVTNNCLWVMPNGYAHAYCVGMGWEPLIVEPDGILYRAPADFHETGVRSLDTRKSL